MTLQWAHPKRKQLPLVAWTGDRVLNKITTVLFHRLWGNTSLLMSLLCSTIVIHTDLLMWKMATRCVACFMDIFLNGQPWRQVAVPWRLWTAVMSTAIYRQLWGSNLWRLSTLKPAQMIKRIICYSASSCFLTGKGSLTSNLLWHMSDLSTAAETERILFLWFLLLLQRHGNVRSVTWEVKDRL